MKIPFLIACLLFCAKLGLAQSILNGSFEDNSLDTNTYCHWDMTYEMYDSTVSNSNTLNPVTGHHLFNMIYYQCMYTWTTDVWGPPAQQGNWFLMLYGEHHVWIPNELIVRQEGSISLGLSAPLEVGKSYRLSYYIQAYPQYPPYPSQAIQDRITGLGSAPDIGTSFLEVGISESDTAFGEIIHTSVMPPQAQWLKQSIDFTPNFSAQHITCRIFVPENPDSVEFLRYSLFIDNFSLSDPTALNDREKTLVVYPNPTQGIAHVQHPTATEVVLHDLMGKEHYRKTLVPQQEHSLHLEHLPRGMYMLSLKNNKAVWEQKRLMKL